MVNEDGSIDPVEARTMVVLLMSQGITMEELGFYNDEGEPSYPNGFWSGLALGLELGANGIRSLLGEVHEIKAGEREKEAEDAAR